MTFIDVAHPLIGVTEPITGLTNILSHPFVRHALVAGTAIGALCGLIGFFLMLREQIFAADALSHVAYTGSLAALAIGIDARFGLFAATMTAGVVLGLLRGRGATDDAVIGTAFAWILGLGVLCLAIYTRHGSANNSSANVHALFGSIFGINAHDATTTAITSAALITVLVAIARPLLFATIDGAVATARGVPVKTLGVVFLVLVGGSAAQATQAVGALLLIGLLAVPAATARLLTNRPWRAFALSGLIAVAAIWTGISFSYAVPTLPPSFAIISTATAGYCAAALINTARRRQLRNKPSGTHQGAPHRVGAGFEGFPQPGA
jgi:zinc/manganese transport system permease protein